jgi:hypothetical protein
MARVQGLLALSGNWEPQMAAPFDGRSLVEFKSDLILNSTWLAKDGNNYAYKGMIVVVINDATLDNNGIYYLTNSDYTNINNWVKSGTGSGSGGLKGLRLNGISSSDTLTLPASAKLDSIYITTDTSVSIVVDITTNSITSNLFMSTLNVGEITFNINLLPSLIHSSDISFTGTFGVAVIDVIIIYNEIVIS